MRLPKKVCINNRPWMVIKNKKTSNCSFSYRDMKINIGTNKNSKREILGGFIHEVSEISCVERGVRATKDTIQHEANDMVFVGDHEKFSSVMNDVSRIISDIMRLE
jgi:hypothetical protein